MINKILIFCTFFLLYANVGFAYSSDNVLNDLEKSMYGQCYSNDSLSNRLIRLETDSFGMAQVGDVNTRLARLYNVASNVNSNSRISTIQPYNITYPKEIKKNKIRSIINNVASSLSSGVMTGYTPTMDTYNYPNNNTYNRVNGYTNPYQSYCPYPNYDNFNRINTPIGNNYYSPSGYQQSYYKPNGYHNIDKNYGYGSRVSIIRD